MAISRQNLSQAIAEEILEWIRSGEVRPGDRLPTEQELMARFEVGRNTVREAVQSLVALGVLDVRPGRGTRVLALSSERVLDSATVATLLGDQTIVDLYEFRLLLEAEIAVLATRRATDHDVAEIAAAGERYRNTLARGEPTYDADIDFHRAIARAAHNLIYVRVLDAIADLVVGARRPLERLAEAREVAAEEHDEIYAAIAARDAERARGAMRGHLTHAMEFVRQEYGLRPGAEHATASGAEDGHRPRSGAKEPSRPASPDPAN